MNEISKVGFQYLVEVVRSGTVISSEVVDNLIPTQGMNHILDVVLRGAPQNASWYIGIYEGTYTPDALATAAALPSAATECVAYQQSGRQAFTAPAASGGQTSNTASRAEFTMTENKTVRGGFIVSAQPKGSVSGTLLSVVRFASPKVLESGDTLRVTAGISLQSN